MAEAAAVKYNGHHERGGALTLEKQGVYSETTCSEVLQQFGQHPLLSVFLLESFDATSYARSVLGQSTAAASNQALEEGLAALESELRAEVVIRHEELLEQVGGLRETESSLGVVRVGVSNLQAAVTRVRAEIAEPYRQIQTRTRQLAALNETVDLLRRVLRLLKLIAKLRDQLAAANPDLSKAAKLLSDIEVLKSEGDISGVDVLDAEAAWLANIGKELRAKADLMLKQGMQTLSQTDVGSVLQVYYNLNELEPAVRELQARYVQQLTTYMSAALDPAKISAVSAAAGAGNDGSQGPGGAYHKGGPQAGGAQRWQHALWQQLGSCMEALLTPVVAMWHLQRVMAKKRDPFTHVCFLDFLLERVHENKAQHGSMLSQRVWREVVNVLESSLTSAYHGASGVKEALVVGYPQLAALLEAAFTRILRDTDVKGVPPAVYRDDIQLLHKAAEVFCNAYLGRALTRLSDAVNALFTTGSRSANQIPGAPEVAKLMHKMKEELEAAMPDPRVTSLVANVVSKAVKLLGEKCEYQMATGPDARQVAAPCTAGQQRNLQLCNVLQEVHMKVIGLAGTLPAGAADILKQAVDTLDTIAQESMAPLFKAITEKLEQSLLKIHQEDFDVEISTTTTNCSKYIDEVLQVMTHFNNEFLSILVPGGGAGGCAKLNLVAPTINKVASRILELFVRHAALVRPLSETGKLRLARDMAELELAVGQTICPVEQLGAPYRALRAFRPLLFLETSQVPTSPLLKELPFSVVLHHLYSRAPKELVSPYGRAGLTAVQYSLWMDQHSEEEVWRGVKGTLDSYMQSSKALGQKLDPVHEVMLSLGSTAFRT